MYFEIGNYVIETDKYNYMLREKHYVEKGENAGNIYLKTIGFYSNLERAIHGLIEHEVMEKQEGNNLKELIEKSVKSIMEQLK